MKTLSHVLGSQTWYLNRYEDLIYRRYLSRYARQPYGHEEVWRDLDTLREDSPPLPGLILDLGCGTGWYARRLTTKFERRVVGIDQSQRVVDWASERRDRDGISSNRLSFRVGDLDEGVASFGLKPDEQVAEAWLCGCLHQTRHPHRVLRDVVNTLEEGGRICIQTLEEPAHHNEHMDIWMMRRCGQKVFRPGEVHDLLDVVGCGGYRARHSGLVAVCTAVKTSNMKGLDNAKTEG